MIHTHEVENQAPPREGVDEYTSNVPLVEAVARWGRAARASASRRRRAARRLGRVPA